MHSRKRNLKRKNKERNKNFLLIEIKIEVLKILIAEIRACKFYRNELLTKGKPPKKNVLSLNIEYNPAFSKLSKVLKELDFNDEMIDQMVNESVVSE